MVGTVVGHQYGWLRNSTPSAGTARWLPDLSSGWEYRPLVRGGDLPSWRSDDGTLRIESLRGYFFSFTDLTIFDATFTDIEKVTELIRDIKNSEEVD